MTGKLSDLKVGMRVRRLLGSVVEVDLTVTKIDDHIHCGPWKFHKETGYEVDEDLGWDGVTHSGSRLIGIIV